MLISLPFRFLGGLAIDFFSTSTSGEDCAGCLSEDGSFVAAGLLLLLLLEKLGSDFSDDASL